MCSEPSFQLTLQIYEAKNVNDYINCTILLQFLFSITGEACLTSILLLFFLPSVQMKGQRQNDTQSFQSTAVLDVPVT